MRLFGHGDDRKLGTVVQFENIAPLIAPGRRLSNIEEQSLEGLSESSNDNIFRGHHFEDIFPRNKNLSPASGSLLRQEMIYFIRKKQSEIFIHEDNITHFDILKNENIVAKGNRQKLDGEYKVEKSDLNGYRKKRNHVERLLDRQLSIEYLGSKNDLVSKARVFFAKKLTVADQEILSVRKDIESILKKNIPSKEKKLIVKNRAVISNENLIKTNRDQMVLLKRTIHSTAADLYAQVGLIENGTKELFTEGEVVSNLKIKNGKYLLIPLLNAGEFGSVGKQLAYQGRRMMKKTRPDNALDNAPHDAVRSSRWPLNDRVEI
jgi:hypothetical protein